MSIPPRPRGRVDSETPPVAEDIARAFHNAYEAFSTVEGWETQEATRAHFDDLPEANRRTILRTVQFLIDCGVIL